MKKISLIVMLLISLGLKAQTPVLSFSCPEIYAKVTEKKLKQEQWMLEKGASAYGLSLPALFTGNIYIVAGLLLTGSAMLGYSKMHDAREIRVRDLQTESSKRLKRFTKKMQKLISASIQEKEIVEIINTGMSSGLYCEHFPELASPRDIKAHVRSVLEYRNFFGLLTICRLNASCLESLD